MKSESGIPSSSPGWPSPQGLAVNCQESARYWGLDFFDLTGFAPNADLLAQFPAPVLFKHSVLPLQVIGTRIQIALSDPRNFAVLEELTAFSGLLLEPVLADQQQIEQALRQHFGVGGGTVHDLLADGIEEHATSAAEVNQVSDANETASVIKLVNELLADAVRQEASDIHLEPEGQQLVVRFRVDGVLHRQAIPADFYRFRLAIVSRLKIMARLNIAEKRVAQDGGFRIQVRGRDLDVRVSVIPMQFGEGVVMRLLDKSRMELALSGLDIPHQVLSSWQHLIAQPHGLLLVTGPTGSGKTTTLYASLQHINTEDKKIITIEDPIEYSLRGANQIQVHNKVGLTFASGLRSVLRHDPDVILIGEIRDQDTATACIQASLTGHLVLSTLHTNDAIGAFSRLVDMGVERYLVSSTLHGVLAQRLVRRLCVDCRQLEPVDLGALPSDFPTAELMRLDTIQAEAQRATNQLPVLYQPRGCTACNQTGYRGRLAIFEMLRSTSQLRQQVAQGASHETLRIEAMRQGITSLRQSGWQRVLAGHTTIAEVLRVATSELD